MYSARDTINILNGDSTEIEVVLGWQPKVVFFWWCGNSSATDNSAAGTSRVGFGCAKDGSNRWAVGTRSVHDVATSDEESLRTVTACIATISGTVIDGAGDFQLDASGFTIIIDDAFPADMKVSYLALGGSEITDVYLNGNVVSDGGTPQSFEEPTFQPNFVLIANAYDSDATPPAQINHATMSVGAATGTSNEASIAIACQNAVTTPEYSGYCQSYECGSFCNQTDAAPSNRGEFSAFDSLGFDINWLEHTGAKRFAYVAIKGGSWYVGNFVTSTSPGDLAANTDPGFKPAAVMFFSANKAEATQNTGSPNAILSVGCAVDETDRGAQAFHGEDRSGVENTQVNNAIEYDEVYINIDPATPGTPQGLMDLKSMDTNGFTCTMDDGDPSASFVWYIAAGPAEEVPPSAPTGPCRIIGT